MRDAARVGGTRRPNPLPIESLFESSERGEPTFRCTPDVLSFDIRAPEADGGEVVADLGETVPTSSPVWMVASRFA